MNNINHIVLKGLDKKSKVELLDLYHFMNDPLSMSIRNQRHEISQPDLQSYLNSNVDDGKNFILIKYQNKTVGYFQVNVNPNLVHLYFSFLWDMTNLFEIFSIAFEKISTYLNDSHNINRLVLPITGDHTNIEVLLLAHPRIKKTVTLQQEHLDKDNNRQPVIFYESYIS